MSDGPVPAPKAGYLTSEFWLSLIVALGGLATVILKSQHGEAAPGDVLLAGLGAATALLAQLGYTFNRQTLKIEHLNAAQGGAK